MAERDKKFSIVEFSKKVDKYTIGIALGVIVAIPALASAAMQAAIASGVTYFAADRYQKRKKK